MIQGPFGSLHLAYDVSIIYYSVGNIERGLRIPRNSDYPVFLLLVALET